MKLRPLQLKDAAACRLIMHRAVHIGAQRHYTLEQREAWSPSLAAETSPLGQSTHLAATFAHRPAVNAPAPYGTQWPKDLTRGFAMGATRWGRLVGFFTMGEDAHIDFAYVLPNEMGQGTAARLYDVCEAQAFTWEQNVLSTEASHLARRFFEKRGWQVTAKQSVIRGGVALENFRMEKHL